MLMDCYTEPAAKASKFKNPVKDVGAQIVSGLDYPEYVAEQTGLAFVGEHEMTPENMISQLDNAEQKIFHAVYGGKFAKKLYRLYEYACSDRNPD